MQHFDAVPKLTQMFGEGAENRYFHYMARTKKAFKGKKVDISSKNFKSDFERRYFEAMRVRRATED